MWNKFSKGALVAMLIASEAAAPALAAAPASFNRDPTPQAVRTLPEATLAQVIVPRRGVTRAAPVVRTRPGVGAPRSAIAAPGRRFVHPGGPAIVAPGRRVVQPAQPVIVAPGRPIVRQGRPIIVAPGRRFVRPGIHYAVRPWRRRPHYGRVFAGVVLGTILAVGIAHAAPPPPSPELCWYWADEFETRGYWDYCE